MTIFLAFSNRYFESNFMEADSPDERSNGVNSTISAHCGSANETHPAILNYFTAGTSPLYEVVFTSNEALDDTSLVDEFSGEGIRSKLAYTLMVIRLTTSHECWFTA